MFFQILLTLGLNPGRNVDNFSLQIHDDQKDIFGNPTTLFANNRVLNRMSLPILGNFCTRLSEMLEAKKARIPFWNNLSISNIITATLCYLISKCFPAESVPRCMSSLFSTVPFTNQKTGSVYQCRG